MKNLLIGLALSVAVSAPAFASDATKKCEAVEELSVSTMKLRQLGLSLTEALKLNEDNDEFVKAITMDAYSQPAMRTPENALRQRTEFGVKWMLKCIKNT